MWGWAVKLIGYLPAIMKYGSAIIAAIPLIGKWFKGDPEEKKQDAIDDNAEGGRDAQERMRKNRESDANKPSA